MQLMLEQLQRVLDCTFKAFANAQSSANLTVQFLPLMMSVTIASFQWLLYLLSSPMMATSLMLG